MNALQYEVLVHDGIRRHRKQTLPDGSPIVSSPVTSTLIYGDHDAVLVDPPFTYDQIERRLGMDRTVRQDLDPRLRHPRARRSLVWHRALVAALSRRHRLRNRGHHRHDAPAGHHRTRPDVGCRLPRPDSAQPRCLPTHSGRRLRIGRSASAGRRGRTHRHRRHHRAARPVDRASRRRRRRLQRRAPVPAGKRARRHRIVADRTGHRGSAQTTSGGRRPQEQIPAGRSRHHRADPAVPAGRTAPDRRKAHAPKSISTR